MMVCFAFARRSIKELLVYFARLRRVLNVAFFLRAYGACLTSIFLARLRGVVDAYFFYVAHVARN